MGAVSRTERKPHILNVAIEPGSLCDEHSESGLIVPTCMECESPPSFAASIECPGIVEGGCASWLECSTCRDQGYDVEQIDETGMAHGIEHEIIGGLPMVPDEGCYVQHLMDWNGTDDAHDIGLDHGPGRYEIDWDGGLMEDAVILYVGPAPE